MDWLTLSVNRTFREAAEDYEDFKPWFCDESAEILVIGPMQAVAIDRIKREALKDQSYMGLVTTVADHVEEWPEYLKLYKKYRKEIGADDGLAYYKGRVIVPPTLRSPIIRLLHIRRTRDYRDASRERPRWSGGRKSTRTWSATRSHATYATRWHPRTTRNRQKVQYTRNGHSSRCARTTSTSGATSTSS